MKVGEDEEDSDPVSVMEVLHVEELMDHSEPAVLYTFRQQRQMIID